jgi:branched-subunit amino acid transport protein
VTDLVPLAVLMFLATYPSRAIPLLAANVGRLPPPALAYLRLVGPAVLAALAAVDTVVTGVATAGGRRAFAFHVGVEWLAVAACVAFVLWRRNLLLGITAAVALVAGARLAGVA